jgi:hypothetical protein
LHLFKVEKIWSANDNIFPIIFMGDFHVGSPNCDYKLLSEHVKRVSELENAMVFLMGDQAEWIVIGDRRFKPSQIDKRFWGRSEDLPMAYLDYLENLLAPIAHMIEVVHDGNHEESMFPTMYPGAELCSRLRTKVATEYSGKIAQEKLRYAPGEAYTKITWKTKTNSDYRTVTINSAHGWQAGRMPGAKHNEISHMFGWIGASIIMRGHSHELFAEPAHPREMPNPQMTKLVEEQTICGHTGSYLKTREVGERPGYAEKNGYPPLTRGHVEVDISLLDTGMSKTIQIR